MMVSAGRFNLYLVILVGLMGFSGCKTAPEKKQMSAVRLHMEMNPDSSGRSKPTPIYRASPVIINLETAPFVTEGNIKSASVVDTIGGFAVRLEFERRGAWLLEQYTSMHSGKRVGIYGEFVYPPGSKTNNVRWMAAPVISKRIDDGVLIFTPDATLEESHSWVLGLNNLAKKIDDQLKW